MDAYQGMQRKLLHLAGWRRIDDAACEAKLGLDVECWCPEGGHGKMYTLDAAWAAYDSRFRAVRYAPAT